MKGSEIRSAFLNYFARNGHQVIESSSLVPHNDPTLLFTNAGMNQFKDVFLGKDKRTYTRAVTSQKVVRAGGKHNDLENVGFTARHHTFFEMLGNFSFGDYFKKEAIHFAWEFVTQELKLPKDRLYVTVFKTDDEAAKIWNEQEGVPLDRIFRFDEKDNFWSMGDTGPCGPCSEIFIDRGAAYAGPECGKTKTCTVGCDCDRYMEFWNLVFMQYDRDKSGKLNPLPKPSVDTGMGLERVATILQDVNSNYDTDVFREIIHRTEELCGKTYRVGNEDAASFRVIADHSRAAAFLIGDGVMPSNEGRGYVLRRIMRRGIRLGRKLGFRDPFLYKTAGFVIDQMGGAYPSLVEKRAFIERAIQAEEDQFFRTLERGLALLDDEMKKLSRGQTLPGPVVFKLYDTFGFPADLTRVISSEAGLLVDEAGFETEMERQRSESRKNWKGSGDATTNADYLQLAQQLRPTPIEFVGYTSQEATGKVLAVLPATTGPDNTPAVDVVVSTTPFYGESGGQVGDHGTIWNDRFRGKVVDVQKPVPELIVLKVLTESGTLSVGDTVQQQTDRLRRSLTEANHTATHLLHWALRKTLGTHVQQQGSLVTPELLRFDFSHFQPLHADEIRQIETLINDKIWANELVDKRELPKEQAIQAGAIAFFGDKYGDKVRVVSVGDFSTELCGGTHVNRSGDIHLFKIASESGIAAGVRRIIAYTHQGAFQYFNARENEIKEVKDRLKASSTDEVLAKVDRLLQTEKELRKQLEKLQAQSAAGEVDALIAKARSKGAVKVICELLQADSTGAKRLREVADQIKAKASDSVTVLGMVDQGKAHLIVACGATAMKTHSAQNILKEIAPLIDGRGGGKPEMAQAGGTSPGGISAALEKAFGMI